MFLNELKIGQNKYSYYSLKKLGEKYNKEINKLPATVKILLESIIRNSKKNGVDETQIKTLLNWSDSKPDSSVLFFPGRVLLQDFTGVPVLVDLAAIRSEIKRKGGDPSKVNPAISVDLVVDHSVKVHKFAEKKALEYNSEKEFEDNIERYKFLHWGQKAFNNLKVVPPSTGICHQVNLEYLAKIVQIKKNENVDILYPDTLVGTDSHTTMINGVGVLGWGVGGIEAEAAMLGEGLALLVPEIVGFKIEGKLSEGLTATDLVLTITELLRKKDVVGKYIEFYGSGLKYLSVPDRATIANMCPEFGATSAFFPVDEKTLDYFRLTGRDEKHIEIIRSYLKAQGLFYEEFAAVEYSENIYLDAGSIEASIAGPKRPQDRISIKDVKKEFCKLLNDEKYFSVEKPEKRIAFKESFIGHGSVFLAAITSCTNTSNPWVMLGAGLLAKAAVENNLNVPSYVKTSLAPGSQVVKAYLERSGLIPYLEKLGFHIVGFGCTSCIGNSGNLDKEISDLIKRENIVSAAVLSGNRNFEGRINPDIRANYLASPPLVIAYALAGKIDIDFGADSLGVNSKGKEVFLKDIWPSNDDIINLTEKFIKPEIFKEKYADVYTGNKKWNSIKSDNSEIFAWDRASSYIKEPSFLENISYKKEALKDIKEARVLLKLGDSITTDHISPAGAIQKESPAGRYLSEKNVSEKDFNSYGSRRGNHEVMHRGTFANLRLKNQLVPGRDGGFTIYHPDNEVMTVFEAAEKYQSEETALIIIAGIDYGMGSSRDWAAKGTFMLGVKAVIAESFERIHRSNLIGMGVLPLEFLKGENAEILGLTGTEQYDITGVEGFLSPGKIVRITADNKIFSVKLRLNSDLEIDYFMHGGILNKLVRDYL